MTAFPVSVTGSRPVEASGKRAPCPRGRLALARPVPCHPAMRETIGEQRTLEFAGLRARGATRSGDRKPVVVSIPTRCIIYDNVIAPDFLEGVRTGGRAYRLWPFEPSGPAEAAGIAALDDRAFLHRSLEANARGLRFLAASGWRWRRAKPISS